MTIVADRSLLARGRSPLSISPLSACRWADLKRAKGSEPAGCALGL